MQQRIRRNRAPKGQTRIEVSYEILRAAPKRPISAQLRSEWARKSGCAALRMTVISLREWRIKAERAAAGPNNPTRNSGAWDTLGARGARRNQIT